MKDETTNRAAFQREVQAQPVMRLRLRPIVLVLPSRGAAMAHKLPVATTA
jgi:hypothetical protein